MLYDINTKIVINVLYLNDILLDIIAKYFNYITKSIKIYFHN